MKREQGVAVECFHLGKARPKVHEIEEPRDADTGTKQCEASAFVADDAFDVEQCSNATRIDERHRTQVEDHGLTALPEAGRGFDEVRCARKVEFAIDDDDRRSIDSSAFDSKGEWGLVVAHLRATVARPIRRHTGDLFRYGVTVSPATDT